MKTRILLTAHLADAPLIPTLEVVAAMATSTHAATVSITTQEPRDRIASIGTTLTAPVGIWTNTIKMMENAMNQIPETPPFIPDFESDQTRQECYQDGWAACCGYAAMLKTPNDGGAEMEHPSCALPPGPDQTGYAMDAGCICATLPHRYDCPARPRLYTPGPWYVEDDFHIMSDAGPVLARVLTHEDFPCVDEEDKERIDKEAAANAKLMSAAPELLRACQDLLTHASVTEHMSARAVENARAAVAKAGGS